jgi:hypothetical protein
MAFDAPDDSWLAIGPRTGGGGSQLVWIWNKSGRQIDVQALDLSIFRSPPDEESFTAQMATRLRGDGATVAFKTAVLAGERCHHLEIKRADGWEQDMFILFANQTNYSVMITQPSRDPKLVEQARKGFRLESE